MKIPGTLYIISAPSGGGKTSLVNALLESVSNLEVSISYTTRAPRPGEKEGVDYHFVDEAQFKRFKKKQAFLEDATVFGHYYATSVTWVTKKIEAGIDIILEIDWQGARQIREKMPESIGIFIIPPSWETLEKRLRLRAQDEESVIKKRMADAKAELEHFDEYDYLILNDNFSNALADLNAILRVRRLRSGIQKRELAPLLKDLLKQPFSN
ncbi:guanylate kinase [Candidatus Rickettsiella viridis]|uniref:Guanylate kinase n=1 Tax=Candidatus Rickettsiella viridis TaxID=676208 RepID=A0A2Z5UXA1_9COXI|nr:guanylate kinase [Candidatus Rickettsiella viridis]BBB15751.1 guanylate kinase [Candidatus Rickettsiella viridis]